LCKSPGVQQSKKRNAKENKKKGMVIMKGDEREK